MAPVSLESKGMGRVSLRGSALGRDVLTMLTVLSARATATRPGFGAQVGGGGQAKSHCGGATDDEHVGKTAERIRKRGGI